MNVLDALQAYLRQKQATPDLPDAVIYSLMGPSYAEGERMPFRDPVIEHEMGALEGPRRQDRFVQELSGARDFYRNSEMPLPEGWWVTGRQPGESPWASPLNSLMRRGLALY